MIVNPHETAQGVARLPLERELVHVEMRRILDNVDLVSPLSEDEWRRAVDAWLIHKHDYNRIALDALVERYSQSFSDSGS